MKLAIVPGSFILRRSEARWRQATSDEEIHVTWGGAASSSEKGPKAPFALEQADTTPPGLTRADSKEMTRTVPRVVAATSVEPPFSQRKKTARRVKRGSRGGREGFIKRGSRELPAEIETCSSDQEGIKRGWRDAPRTYHLFAASNKEQDIAKGPASRHLSARHHAVPSNAIEGQPASNLAGFGNTTPRRTTGTTLHTCVSSAQAELFRQTGAREQRSSLLPRRDSLRRGAHLEKSERLYKPSHEAGPSERCDSLAILLSRADNPLPGLTSLP